MNINDKKKEVGKRIEQLRKQKHLKQKELAELLGNANDQMVSKWENGSTFPSLIYLLKLQKVLDTTYEYLLDGTESRDKLVIKTYKDFFRCVIALLETGNFTPRYDSLGQNEQFSLAGRFPSDDQILDFFKRYGKLKEVLPDLGQEDFDKQVEKLLNTFDYEIEKR